MKYITYALITAIGIITISLVVTIDYFNGVNKDLTSRIEALETQIEETRIYNIRSNHFQAKTNIAFAVKINRLERCNIDNIDLNQLYNIDASNVNGFIMVNGDILNPFNDANNAEEAAELFTKGRIDYTNNFAIDGIVNKNKALIEVYKPVVENNIN